MSQIIEITVPDIGDFDDVPVIELFVKVGDTVQAEDSIVTLESDKATMDVPSPAAGTIKELLVKVGDRVKEGSLLVRLEAQASQTSAQAVAVEQKAEPAAPVPAAPAVKSESAPVPQPIATPQVAQSHYEPLSLGSKVHASPSIRAYARELGVNLSLVSPNGPHGRILREDITQFVKQQLAGATSAASTGSGSGLDLLPWPKINFSKFGETEIQALSKIKKVSGQNLSRNWVMIPAITLFEEADITDLEKFRVDANKEQEKLKTGHKLTMLAFLVKACVRALQEFPEFNSSLDGDNLIYKKYFNIGFAADTPNGLVVPVVKNADRKPLLEISDEITALASKARAGKLTPSDMSGACFTISSLGGIGGTGFTPIINAPEVAILGVNRSSMKPIWNGSEFEPRLMLPLSLSADHRVIDGALAAKFNVYLARILSDYRRVLL